MTLASGVDWGNVPAWVGSILTSGSLALGFYILLRDRRKEERLQAMQLVCWGVLHGNESAYITAPEFFEYTIHIYNGSNYPITRPAALLERLSIEAAKRRQDATASRLEQFADREWGLDGLVEFTLSGSDTPLTFLEPAGQATVTLRLTRPPAFYRIEVHFGDSMGKFWLKDILTGSLTAISRVVV